jgi:hypothetical protein
MIGKCLNCEKLMVYIMTAITFESKHDTITIPRDLFEDMLSSYHKMEQIMATLEVSLDTETMNSIKRSKEDIENGDFMDCSFDEIDDVLA